MSTPNQPDKPRNGTAAGAPTSGSPRNQGPPPVRTAENQPGTTGQPDDAATRAMPNQPPPWQRGEQQRAPQTNVSRPDAEGRARAVGPDPERSVRTEAARAKAAVIDGPTRSLARPELSKDLPDLSETRHTTPPEGRPGQPGVAAVPHAYRAGEPLRATIQVRKIDPWSTLKVSLVLSVCLFFVWMVAVGLLYLVLEGMGVWDRLNNAFTDIVSDGSTDGLVTAGQVFGYSAVIGLINAVLLTALATIGSFIYNQCSDLVGGVEVTLADPD